MYNNMHVLGVAVQSSVFSKWTLFLAIDQCEYILKLLVPSFNLFRRDLLIHVFLLINADCEGQPRPCERFVSDCGIMEILPTPLQFQWLTESQHQKK